MSNRSDHWTASDSRERWLIQRGIESDVRRAVRVLGADRVRKIVDETQSNDYLQPGEAVT